MHSAKLKSGDIALDLAFSSNAVERETYGNGVIGETVMVVLDEEERQTLQALLMTGKDINMRIYGREGNLDMVLTANQKKDLQAMLK